MVGVKDISKNLPTRILKLIAPELVYRGLNLFTKGNYGRLSNNPLESNSALMKVVFATKGTVH